MLFVTAKHETEARAPRLPRRRGGLHPQAVSEAEEVLSRVETHLHLSRLTRELAARNAELEAEIARRRAAEDAREAAHAKLSSLAAREAQRWGLAGFIGQQQADARNSRTTSSGCNTSAARACSSPAKAARARNSSRARSISTARAPRRRSSPVNCVAIPGELAESMFFGHVKGAFTGATADRKG